MFPAVVKPHDRAHFFLHLINRACAHRPAGGALFIGEMDAKAVRILIAHPRFGELFAGPCAKAGHIPSKHIVFCFALDNPFGRQKPHAARLAKAGNDTIAAKIVFQLGRWAKEHIAVR